MPYTLTRPAFTKFALARTTESPKTKNTTRKLRRKHLNSQASKSLKTLLIEVTTPIIARRRSFIKTETHKLAIMSLSAVAELIAHPKNSKLARRNAAQPNSQNTEFADLGNARPRDCHARASESIVRYSYSHTAQNRNPKRESAQKRSYTRRNHNASGGCPNKIQTQTRNANPPEDGGTGAAFRMQAVMGPTKMTPKRGSARRQSHTRHIHNASRSGPNKIETQTQISANTVTPAPQLQCKRWWPEEN